MDVKFFKCMHCGNVAIKPFDQGVPMFCCGEKMVELRANDTDGAKEKHVPQVVVDGSTVHVKVGMMLADFRGDFCDESSAKVGFSDCR